MCAPEGNSDFCFPENLNVSQESQMFPKSLNVSRDEVEENIETQGKKNSLFPKGVHIKSFVT